MSDVASQLACLSDARLAAHATSAAPAWLWIPDGTRVLWANAVGAAIFGAPSPEVLAARTFDPQHSAAAQIARLAGSLRHDGALRLERLRGFGGGMGRALVCACSRIALADRTPGILVVATEPAGPTLALGERVRRLIDGSGLAVAAFAPDGPLLHATAEARIRPQATLAALGLDMLAADALAHGRAEGDSARGRLTLARLGADATTVLVAVFTAEPLAPPTPAASVSRREDAPAEPASQDPAAQSRVPAAPEAPEARFSPDHARSMSTLMSTPISAPVSTSLPAQPRHDDAPSADRRHPLRFVWQMDAAGHFTLGSDEFSQVIGAKIAAALGQPWPDVNAALALDPEDQVVRAIASRDTWSGITVSWPIDGCADRLKVELSGLPIFDHNRMFQGYRGFGVCRDVERIATLIAMRRPPPPPPPAAARIASPPEPPPTAAPEAPTVVSAAANVVPFRAGGSSADVRPAPSPVEHSAFHELARQLNARLASGADVEPEGMGGARTAAASTQSAAGVAQHIIPEPVTDSVAVVADPPAHAADAARATELAAVLDAVTDGVLVMEPDGRITITNRAAEALFGYDSGELLARRFAELLAPASRTMALESLADLASRPSGGGLADPSHRGSHGGYDIIGQARHGATLPLRLWLRRTADGARICATLRDATAEQQAERELAAARAAAEEASAERTAALKAAAEKAAADKAEFVAKVGHELHAPLDSIIGFTEVMLEERFGPITNERYREYLKDIRASGGHAVALLDDLALLAKIAAGQLDLEAVALDLNDTVQACVAQMQPQASRERIIIRTSLAPNLPAVVADAGALRQIVVNLLANAIRLTGAGGQVIVSTAAGEAGEPLLRVRDTGIGMDEKELAAMLEPFRQGATVSRASATRTGLCVPLTRALAQANGARFTTSSRLNGGTLVEIAFRAAAHAERPA